MYKRWDNARQRTEIMTDTIMLAITNKDNKQLRNIGDRDDNQ